MKPLQRVLPFIQILKHVPNPRKLDVLRSFPAYVTDDIIEVLYNILSNNIPVKNSRHRAVLNKNHNQLSELYASSRNKRKRQQILYKQKGGFLGALLPLIISALGGVLASTV